MTMKVKKLVARRMNRIGFNWINSHSTDLIQSVENNQVRLRAFARNCLIFHGGCAVGRSKWICAGDSMEIAIST